VGRVDTPLSLGGAEACLKLVLIACLAATTTLIGYSRGISNFDAGGLRVGGQAVGMP